MTNPNKCSTKGCKEEYALTIKGKKICWKCWSKLCNQELIKEEIKDEQPHQGNI